MDFRRSGQRDERRRRVLLEETGVAAEGDELAAAASEPVTESPSSEPARRYSEAALSPRQPRVIDLIPTRRWTNLVLLLSLLSSVAGLEGAYGYLALRQWPTGPLPYGALDLSTHGSVATWLTAAWLGISAVMGILTYQIRRYRVDDYRGRYRMWYWMVPMLLLGSVDAVAGIQQTVRTARARDTRHSAVRQYSGGLVHGRGDLGGGCGTAFGSRDASLPAGSGLSGIGTCLLGHCGSH